MLQKFKKDILTFEGMSKLVGYTSLVIGAILLFILLYRLYKNKKLFKKKPILAFSLLIFGISLVLFGIAQITMIDPVGKMLINYLLEYLQK